MSYLIQNIYGTKLSSMLASAKLLLIGQPGAVSCLQRAKSGLTIVTVITWFPPLARLVSNAAIEPYLWAISLVCNIIGRISSGITGDRIGLVKVYIATTLLLTVISWTTWLVRLLFLK